MLGLDWKNSVKKSLYLHDYKQSEMFIKLFITLEFRELIELIELLLNLEPSNCRLPDLNKKVIGYLGSLPKNKLNPIKVYVLYIIPRRQDTGHMSQKTEDLF
jgi:hypothetical protein